MSNKPTQHDTLRVLHNLWIEGHIETSKIITILEHKGYELQELANKEITATSFDGTETISIKILD